jgi:transcriptional regulator GlxA family with amidase domain
MKLETCHPDDTGAGAALLDPPSSVGAGAWSGGERAPRGLAAGENQGILRAIRTIRHEYSRPLTVSSLARECGMSVRSLHRLYRSVTGNTIGKDLIARRVAAAAALLRQEDSKLEPVAMETGLRNAKNLCRLFKEHLGLTPGQWKESFHGQSRCDR